jgi:hypothetical protein
MNVSPTTSSTTPSGTVEPLVLTPDQTRESFPAVMGFLHAYFPGQALYTVVRLKVPDAIGSGCFTVDEIVRRVAEVGGGSINADEIRPEALYRCLRLLAANGFFEESESPEDGSAMYRLTPMGALLQTNVMLAGGGKQPSLGVASFTTWRRPCGRRG